MRTVHGSQLAKAQKVQLDGHTFDSKAEARRWGTLKLLQVAGEISNLSAHPRLHVVINGRKIGRGYMVLDFRYVEKIDGAWRTVYEDTKGGADTALAKYKRQIVSALYPEYLIRLTQA